MKLLTEKGVMRCGFGGVVTNKSSQTLVFVASALVLVDSDPEHKKVSNCPVPPPQKKCMVTLAVKVGYSDLLRIDGKRVCLDNLEGVVDGPIPGISTFAAKSAGQDFVHEGK